MLSFEEKSRKISDNIVKCLSKNCNTRCGFCVMRCDGGDAAAVYCSKRIQQPLQEGLQLSAKISGKAISGIKLIL